MLCPAAGIECGALELMTDIKNLTGREPLVPQDDVIKVCEVSSDQDFASRIQFTDCGYVKGLFVDFMYGKDKD